MQKVHELSQPIWMVTHAECVDVAPGRQRRRVGVVLLEDLDDRPLDARARSSSAAAWAQVVGAEHDVDVAGAARTISSRSFWARHPPTAICRPGRSCLQRLEPAEVAVELVVGVLPDAAGVEHDDVGGRRGRRWAPCPRPRAARRCARSRARSSGTRRCARRSGGSPRQCTSRARARRPLGHHR